MNIFIDLIKEKIRNSFEKLFVIYEIEATMINVFYGVMLFLSLFVCFVGIRLFKLSSCIIIFFMYALNVAKIFASKNKIPEKTHYCIRFHKYLYKYALDEPKIFWACIIVVVLILFILIGLIKRMAALIASALFTLAFIDREDVQNLIGDSKDNPWIYLLISLSTFLVIGFILNLFLKVGFSIFFSAVGSLISCAAIFALYISICVELGIDYFTYSDQFYFDVLIYSTFAFFFIMGFIIQISSLKK